MLQPYRPQYTGALVIVDCHFGLGPASERPTRSEWLGSSLRGNDIYGFKGYNILTCKQVLKVSLLFLVCGDE